MYLLLLSALALMAQAVHAYLDTSPFFMFSTSEFLLPTSQLQTADTLSTDISFSLSQCTSNRYIIMNQPAVCRSDYDGPAKSPVLASKFAEQSSSSNDRIRSRASIADVVGSVDIALLTEVLRMSCAAQVYQITAKDDISRVNKQMKQNSKQPAALVVDLPGAVAWGHESRSAVVLKNDQLLGEILEAIGNNFTVLYTTSPETPSVAAAETLKEYDSELPLQEALHIDLRRDLGRRSLAKRQNETLPAGPLFERYQFLSPGIFMGFGVGLLLLFILYVAISGVASLQVSYAAFDKEQGQLASKKQ